MKSAWSAGQLAGRFACTATIACALLGVATSSASATAVPHPRVGKLPGYPIIRGVMPVLATRAQISAHEQLVHESFAQLRAKAGSRTTRRPTADRRAGLGAIRAFKGTPVPNEEPLASCEEFEEALSLITQDMCYRGGPVVHDPKIHLIFWQGEGRVGTKEEHVQPFPAKYEAIVKEYFERLAHDSHLFSNVFAVDEQYGEENSKREYAPGEYAIASPVEAQPDTKQLSSLLPTEECTDESKYSKEGPCLFDKRIKEEVKTIAKTEEAGLGNIYVVLTPPGVGECFEEGECSYRQFCAYHGDFGGSGKQLQGQTLYTYMPYVGEVAGCDAGVHPNEAFVKAEEEEAEKRGELLDEGGDAAIDVLSHEINETVTDPIGSQCDEEAPGKLTCELNAWTDAIGQEVGDKCLPPETTVAGLNGIYGLPLGEVVPGRSGLVYNQVVDGGHYWVQREWSNEASVFDAGGFPLPGGGCVQRVVEASVTTSANPAATVPMTFDGASSGAPGDPATYWVWSFGDGEQLGSESATVTHTYAKPGVYLVTMTAYDAFGSSQGTFGLVTVGNAPPPLASPVSSAPVTTTVTVTTPTPPVAKYSTAQLASLLGLPANGARIAGLGKILLGHAECPPACEVTLKLYAELPGRTHKRHVTRQVLIGTARVKGVPKGAVFVKAPGPGMRELLISLTARGRALLRKRHGLTVKLTVLVEGQEGGVWTIERSLKLKR